MDERILNNEIVPALSLLLEEALDNDSTEINVEWILNDRWKIDAAINFDLMDLEEKND